MKQTSIPLANLSSSSIVYGCMHLGGTWDASSPTPEVIANARACVETAMELGVNFFDHADIYTLGKSEQVFGMLLKEAPTLRPRIILQSKCGIRFPGDPSPGSPQRYDYSREHITRSVDRILQRLGVENLDILLLHRPDPLVEPEEVARAFDDLRSSGKVHHFGVSNHNAAQMALLQDALDLPLVVNQLALNLLHLHLIDEGVTVNTNVQGYSGVTGTLDYCRLHDIKVQAWSPLAKGILGKEPEPGDDGRISATKKIVGEMASAHGVSREAIALAWLMRHPAGIQPVVGTTKPDRLRRACEASKVDLTREEWYRLYLAGRGGALP